MFFPALILAWHETCIYSITHGQQSGIFALSGVARKLHAENLKSYVPAQKEN
jgi:hypothetical protein